MSAPAPLHPLEVRVSIGGDDWDYVRRALRELAQIVEEREPREVGLVSGGCGGCYSIDVTIRDVTPQQFREELAIWHEQNLRERRLAQPAKGEQK